MWSHSRLLLSLIGSFDIEVVIGKAEGVGIEWHGHVTAITVAPEFRRLSVARNLMDYLEAVSDNHHNGKC